MCAGPDLAYTPFFTLAAERVGAAVVFSRAGTERESSVAFLDGAAQRSSFGAVCAVAVLAVGVALGLSGRLRFLRLAEVLPFPAICGLLSGVGCLVLRLCLSLSLSTKDGVLQNLLHFAPTAVLGGIIFSIFKLGYHPALLLPPLAAAVSTFYVCVGVDNLEAARRDGWLFAALEPAGGGSWWPQSAWAEAPPHWPAARPSRVPSTKEARRKLCMGSRSRAARRRSPRSRGSPAPFVSGAVPRRARFVRSRSRS